MERELSYDLHIHSCLSPCGENDMTPATVAGLSALAGLDIIAICDHNTAGNVQAVQQAAAALAPGLLVIPGIELTCAEELHMVCLFPTAEAAEAAGEEIYAALPLPPGEPEPMMNLFGSYYDNQWVITMIPRKRHRPWQYEAEGDDHLLSSPGAADIGGLFITPLEKDFKKINPELLRDVYQQVCLNDRDVEEIFVHLSSN